MGRDASHFLPDSGLYWRRALQSAYHADDMAQSCAHKAQQKRQDLVSSEVSILTNLSLIWLIQTNMWITSLALFGAYHE